MDQANGVQVTLYLRLDSNLFWTLVNKRDEVDNVDIECLSHQDSIACEYGDL